MPKFEIRGWDGKLHQGRGKLVEERDREVVVKLTSNDLGGFGTYSAGAEVIIQKSELLPMPKPSGSTASRSRAHGR